MYGISLDQLIALTASVAACASAVATFLTIKQMAKQQLASVRPELVFSSVGFSGSVGKGTRILSRWTVRHLGVEGGEPSYQFQVPLHNVGLGAARAVTVRWSFPVEETVKLANELASQTKSELEVAYGNGLLTFEGGGTHSACLWMNQQVANVDFVLPTSATKEPKLLSLPSAYTDLCSALIEISMSGEGVEIPNLPRLYATLEFFDIGGNKNTAHFEFVAEVHAIRSKPFQMDGWLDCIKTS